ncbi:MAG: type I-E CRISPR-associated protein Cas7/Cse4/CasC [Myxococcota bacterium]
MPHTSPTPLFLQIHALTEYHGVLLNRDDAGFAKRISIGGATRTRVSSQCLKRHWRRFGGEHSLGSLDAPSSVRSRLTFVHEVVEPLVQEGQFSRALLEEVTRGVMDVVFQRSASKKDTETALKTPQVTIIGEPELRYLREVVRTSAQTCMGELEGDDLEGLASEDEATKKAAVAALEKAFKDVVPKNKELKKNLRGLKLAAGLDAALFGRMVTSDVLARGDAAIHVAHAFTVHEEESESDYFSAVDDILEELGEETGSGHINSSELNSGLYYTYVVVDVPLLVSNLVGCARQDWRSADHTLARGVIESLVHLVAKVSPGAKLGSTAPYSYAKCLLLEAGSAQPRSFADAFSRPVATQGDVLGAAYEALASEIGDFRAMYGDLGDVTLSARGPKESLERALGMSAVPLSDAAAWAAARLDGGTA